MFSAQQIAYFDYNATAVPLPNLSEKVTRARQSHFGNPSSPHKIGREAKDLLENSRHRLAQLLKVQPQELTFTSGGSESNNAVLRQFLWQTSRQHIITSQIEHPSVLETCRILEKMPHLEVTYLPVDRSGRVLPESLKAAIRPETKLISIMTANNETGMVQPIEALAEVAQDYQIPFHTDSVQGIGKMAVDWKKWSVQYATANAHKFGGPHGIGLLYVQQGTPFTGLISGGKQERVRRAGTENAALAFGFAEALLCALEHQETLAQRLTSFKSQCVTAFQSVAGFFLNGTFQNCLPNTLNVGWKGLSAESLLISLDLDGISVSTGSACSSGALEASHVLLAMGLEKSQARSCLRISMGWHTQQAEVDYLIERLLFHARRLYEKKQCKTAS